MDIKVLAGILAFLCLIGIALAIYVLRIQIPLLRAVDTRLGKRVRYLYFVAVIFTMLALSSLLVLDLMTIFGNLQRTTQVVNPVGVYITLLSPIVADVSLAKQALMYFLIKRSKDAGELDDQDIR